MNHKKKLVKFENNEAEIDLDLAPLILELWKRNIATTNSCQETEPGLSWIEFMNGMDVELFLNIVSREVSNKPNSIYQRIIGIMDDCDNMWEFSTTAFDTNMYIDSDEDGEAAIHHAGKPQFVMPISIRFPKTDIKKILKLVKSTTENGDDLYEEFCGGDQLKDPIENLNKAAEKILANHKVTSGQLN